MTADVSDLVTQVRELVNEPQRQQELLQDTAKWNRVTSALDVLGDTQEAVNAYGSRTSDQTYGELYLKWYGLLQAFVVQQDAARLLAGALGIRLDLDDFEDLRIVRDTRISVVGHPVEEGRGSATKSSHFISRPTLSPGGFELLSFTDDGKTRVATVSSKELIYRQATGMHKALEKIRDLTNMAGESDDEYAT